MADCSSRAQLPRIVGRCRIRGCSDGALRQRWPWSFQRQQRPIHSNRAAQQILAQNCYGCHGQAQMSGLDLRQISSILKGGKRGPAVVPGRSGDSLLYKAISGTGDLKMPPGKSALPPMRCARLRPGSMAAPSGLTPPAVPPTESAWWAFRKPQRPAVPQVKNAAWVRTPVDAFILAKLEAEHLTPAPPADKLTLLAARLLRSDRPAARS